MVRNILAALLALTLAACGDDADKFSEPRERPQAADLMSPSAWQIGPVIDGENFSVGMPLRPSPHPEGFSFTFGPGQSPHYVTVPYSSLAGKTHIRMNYRVEAAPDVQIIGGKDSSGCGPGGPSGVTLHLNSNTDNWSRDGYRWWATFAHMPLTGAGDFAIDASLDGPWTSMRTMTAEKNPEEWAAAKANVRRIGFTFSNCGGFGHGATATGPVTFVVTKFAVE